MTYIEVPELHGTVIRRGENGAGGHVYPDLVDPVVVTAKAETFLCLEVEDLDGLIHAPRGKQVAIHMHRNNTKSVI